MYTKEQLQGLRADGKYPLDGKVKSPHKGVKEPLAHTGPIYESEPQHANNIARGGAPKKLADVAVHSGQHARDREGNLVVGQTMTSLANAPDASGARPLDPTIPGKKLTPVSIKPGMRSRTFESKAKPAGGEPGEMHDAHVALHDELNQAHLDNGKRVLGEAVQSGSTNLQHPSRR